MRHALLALLLAWASALAQPAAEITVIRPTSFIGTEATYYIALDDRVLFDLESREHVRFAVAPGRHTLAVRCPKSLYLQYAETRSDQLFKAGEPAFFSISPKFDCVTIDRVDAREGARQIANTSARPAGRPSGYREGKVAGRAAVQTTETTASTPTSQSGAAANERIAAATAAWVEAFNSRDPARMAALYEPDAVLTDTSETRPRVGTAAITDYYKAVAPRQTQRVALGERSIRVFGDTAIDSGNCTYFEMRDGKATTAPGRYSLTYRNHGGKWMIVDHHLSLLPH
jgi:uncharacterized protein (TIGR02246 family)